MDKKERASGKRKNIAKYREQMKGLVESDKVFKKMDIYIGALRDAKEVGNNGY